MPLLSPRFQPGREELKNHHNPQQPTLPNLLTHLHNSPALDEEAAFVPTRVSRRCEKTRASQTRTRGRKLKNSSMPARCENRRLCRVSQDPSARLQALLHEICSRRRVLSQRQKKNPSSSDACLAGPQKHNHRPQPLHRLRQLRRLSRLRVGQARLPDIDSKYSQQRPRTTPSKLPPSPPK